MPGKNVEQKSQGNPGEKYGEKNKITKDYEEIWARTKAKIAD